MRRLDLPAEIGPAFGVRQAHRIGVSRSRLRADDLISTFHGARALAGVELIPDAAADRQRTYPRGAAERHIHERAAQYVPLMPANAFFCGVTAAVLWDAPLPGHLLGGGAEASVDPKDLEIGVPWPSRSVRRKGVRGRAIRPELVSVRTHPVSGLRLASPATTWVMLGPVLTDVYDLVAVGDHFVRARRPRPGSNVAPLAPLATIDQLAAALDAGRRAGAARLREALARVRTGADSRPETRLRLLLVDAGLPEPALDVDVYDRGSFIARVDEGYIEWRIAIEYEGPHHGSGTQWEKDVDRYAALERAGWKVIRVTRRLLSGSPGTVVGRVRAAIDERRR